jgi:acyl-CoA thioesterase FadM
MKTILNTFFNIQGIVHFELILQGQVVNQGYYVEILERLYEAVLRKLPEIWPND